MHRESTLAVREGRADTFWPLRGDRYTNEDRGSLIDDDTADWPLVILLHGIGLDISMGLGRRGGYDAED
jgi:hypothetical protein